MDCVSKEAELDQARGATSRRAFFVACSRWAVGSAALGFLALVKARGDRPPSGPPVEQNVLPACSLGKGPGAGKRQGLSPETLPAACRGCFLRTKCFPRGPGHSLIQPEGGTFLPVP